MSAKAHQDHVQEYARSYARTALAQRAGSGEAIGFIVQHDASGGNFFTAVKSYEGMRKTYGDQCRLVYTAPPAAVQSLTDAEIREIWQSMPGGPDGWLIHFGFLQFACAILAAASAKAKK